jgi:hypothetical protein
MSQLKVNALVSYSGNTVTLGTSGDTINVASGVTFNTASATVNLPTTIKVDTIQNTNSSTLITQTNSTTITVGVSGQTVALPSQSISYAAISNAVDFRNIVINGDMQVAQRATSSASITGSGYHTLDRFYLGLSTLGTWTMSKSTDVPTGYGFASSLKLDCTTADASPSAGDNMLLSQFFEGQNLQYLKKGTASAVSLTASFWVKSTKTGTFICELQDINNSRSISKSYTVSVSNTWEFKTITYAGDTTGALTNDNGASFGLNFWLGAGTTFTSGTLATTWGSTTSANRAVGQVNIADSTSNDWLITGVQLEAGEQASGFEFMPIDTNLARCYRYYYQTVSSESIGVVFSATQASFKAKLPVTMRATPALTMPTSGSFRGDVLNGNKASATAPVSANPTPRDVYWYSLGYSGASFVELVYWTGDPIKISAEL